MIKATLTLLLLITALSLTIQVTNVHFNSKNIYISQHLSLQSSYLTLQDYQINEQDLDKGKLGFIHDWDKLLRIDFNKLLRCYNIEEIDVLKPQLNYQFIDRGDVFVRIFAQDQQRNESVVLHELAKLGKSEDELQLEFS